MTSVYYHRIAKVYILKARGPGLLKIYIFSFVLQVFINYMSLNDLPPPFNLLTLIKTFIPKSNNDYQLLKEESIAQENSIKCRKLIAELTRRYYGVEKQL